MSHKSLFILLLFVLCSCARKTDTKDIAISIPKQRSSPHISFLNVNSFCEDSLGYMWIATLGGLNRYNGYEFMQYMYDAADSTSLNDDFVFSLFYDSSYRLWVGTTMGLNQYNYETNSFVRYSSFSAPVYSLYEDHKKRIWVASASGPGWIDPEQQKVVIAGKQQHINLYWEDSSLRLWMGLSEDKGLAFLKDDNSWHHYALPENRWVTCMYNDPQGIWWLGTNAGLILFNPIWRTFIKAPDVFFNDEKLSKTQISFIKQIEPFKIIIGTTTQGLFQYDFLSQTLLHNEPRQLNPYLSSQLLSYYVDKQGNIWVGSYDKGFVVDNSSLNYFNTDHVLSDLFRNKFVTRVVEDKNKNLWITTRYDGLYCYSSTGKLSAFSATNSNWFPQNNDFLESLFIDSRDRIWIGFDNSLIVGNITKDSHIKTWKKIDLKHVRVVKEDKFGNIWIGTWFGLYKINHDDSLSECKKIYPTPTQSIANVPDICLLQSGDILFSSYGEGIFRIEANEKINPYLLKFSSSNLITNRCITIFEDSNSRIWLGSYGNGTVCISNDKYTIFNRNNGLANNNVLCIQEDVNGNIWTSTSYGISKLTLSINDTIINNYFSIDGTFGDQYHEKAGCKLSDGRIFFAGNHGLTFFNPSTILPNRNPPVIHLEDLKILNQTVYPSSKGSVLTKSITLTKGITLNHKQSTFSLDYSGIDFIVPGKLTYKYKLEGSDLEWNYVGNFRRATYSNLSPGKYCFLVYAINGDGIESKQPASLQITVKPAPWFSWPAWLLYSIIVISVTMIIFRFWFKINMNKQLLEIEHNEHAREREMSEMKINFFANISHELRTPLTLISAPLEQLKSFKMMDDNSIWLLDTISRNVQNMLRLINQLLDFGKIENGMLSLKVKQVDIIQQVADILKGFAYSAQRKHIQLIFSPHVSQLNLWLDTDKFEKILQNLLSNALKYTPEGGTVDIKTNELSSIEACKLYSDTNQLQKTNYIEFSVLDTGPGIPEEKMGDLFFRYRQINSSSGKPDYGGSGIGLHYTKRLIEKHNGWIRAGLRTEVGMFFSFILPLENVYLESDQDKTVESIQSESNSKNLSKTQEQTEKKQPYIILIAEDNIELADFIGNILHENYKVIEALDGEKAWSLVQKESPDLIISDVIMPGLSGYQLCSQVKQHPAFCHIPVILLTAKTTIYDQVEGLEQGADVYICKPFNIDLLLLTIKNLFMGRDRLRQYFSTPKTQDGHSMPVALNPHDQKFMDKLTNLLDKELSNPDININYIARELGFSQTGFYRKIKGLTDMSPIDFLINYRLKRAAEKILENKLLLSEIAEKTGFSSYSYFSKSFKKHFGVNPKEFNKVNIN